MVNTQNPETLSVLEQALRLSPDQREYLGNRLLDSIDAPTLSDDEVRAAWREEIRTRIRDWKSGKTVPLDGDEFLKELEQLEAEETDR